MSRALAVFFRGCRRRGRSLALAAALIAAALAVPQDASAAVAQERMRALDPAVAARLAALSPEHISAADVRDTLAQVPAPRIIALEGSVAFVSMQPFAEFLVAMGYPKDRLTHPRDGTMSYGSFEDSRRLAGEIAWTYEHDGLMPMLIGHSQGGMLAIRTLHELAGHFGTAITVWDPQADAPLARTTIRDPFTGESRPVVGLRVRYAAALATGKLPRVLLFQWSMLPLLRAIPDSVIEFTGYSIPGDLIAGGLLGDEPYRATGTAAVRNVALPASYSHIGLPRVRHLAANAATRAWIDAYVPGSATALPLPAEADTTNLVHAADIWYTVKKSWCLEAQRTLRAVQAAP